jgi:putative peptide zinc metalloprotease protein
MLLGLKVRAALVPERGIQALAGVFSRLYWPPVIVLALLGLVALDAWVFLEHGLGGGLRAALYDPALLLLLFGGIVAATAFHEIGHASACRYGGARPGVLGAGIYLVWPVFYRDVTDAYRLGKAGRLRTDLGGVYFNALFALACGGLYGLTGFEPLILFLVIQHVTILQQLLPLLRLDGYYVVSDLTGVPDILARLRPILRSLIPGRAPEPAVEALKPWARAAVSGYVVALVPVFALLLVLLVIGAPRLFATAWDSLGLQAERVGNAIDDASWLAAAGGGLQVLALVLPCAGIALSFTRLGGRLARGVAGWARGDALRTAVATGATVAIAGLAAYVWWPNGDYEPLRRGERVTLASATDALRAIRSGRPSYTPAREAEFGAVPTERERAAQTREEREPAPERTPEDDTALPAEPEPSAEPTPTADPEEPLAPGATPAAAPTPAPTAPPPVAAESPTPTPPPGPAAPEATPTPTPEATPTPEGPATAPSAEPTVAATPTPTRTPTPTPTVTPTPTPVP